MSSASDPKTSTSLQVSVEEEGPVTRALAVEVGAERVGRSFDRAYRDLARRVRVRGFRPGRAPRGVLEKLYGAAVAEELERGLVAETLPEAMREAGLDAVTQPTVDASPPSPGEPFRYRARVEVRPEIALPGLEGLPARSPKVEVSGADVEAELERLRQQHASLVEESEGVGAAEGHVLTIDYEGRVDDEPFEDGRGQDVQVEIGSARFLEGFEEQLVGARPGDTREVRAPLPGEGVPEDLAGREAVFRVQVKELRRREVPELDDEFAKDLGDFESLDALRARVREDLLAARERESRRALHRSLLDGLLARVSFEVPVGLVERRLERRLAEARRELERSLPEEALHGQLARWREEWRPLAERELREELVLDAVVRDRDIEVDDETLDERLLALAGGKPRERKRLRAAWEQGGMLEALRAALAREQALDWLRAQAKVEEITDS